MTPAQAIQKEIDREQKELDGLEDEKKRLTEKMEKELQKKNKADRSTLEQLIELLGKLLHKHELEQEIEGKKKALAAANARPNDPIGGIDEEYDTEWKRADEIGRKAQGLREKAWRDHLDGKEDAARKAREEAKALSAEFDLELARLRGKSEARRAVQKALKGG